MNNLNIPIYRAKKIDSDEYVIGKLIEDYGIGFYIQINNSLENICNSYGEYGFSTTNFEQIDITTLAIHFHDMLDSQGNKIFASLSEDGKGGDIITYDEDVRIIAIYKNGTFIFKDSMNLAIVPSSRYLRTKAIEYKNE